MRFKHAVFFFLVLSGFAFQPATAQEPTLIFLVRHAERADDGAMTGSEDPHLSEAGHERARTLAHVLANAGITHIHSSDYLRTRETAAPLAEATGLAVAVYDPGDPEAFARELRSTPGKHLVVGHSNSTPALVQALGGEAGNPIEHLEYDRLYLVTLDEGEVTTVLLRFGKPFHAGNPR